MYSGTANVQGSIRVKYGAWGGWTRTGVRVLGSDVTVLLQR